MVNIHHVHHCNAANGGDGVVNKKEMNAKELMIGNLVLDRDGEVMRIGRIGRKKVHQAYFVIDGVRWTSEEIDYIKPIPLTEEWLLKLGFEDRRKEASHWYKYPMVIRYEHNGSLLPCIGSSREQEWCMSYVKYVHQLQNLFFALTGKELTLKLETA